MKYKEGDTVLHPVHGLAVVREVNADRRMLVLWVPSKLGNVWRDNIPTDWA